MHVERFLTQIICNAFSVISAIVTFNFISIVYAQYLYIINNMHVFIHTHIYIPRKTPSSSHLPLLLFSFSFTSPPSNLPAKDMLTMAAGWCSIILAPFLDLSVLRCAIKIPKAGFWKQPPESDAGFYKEQVYAKHGLRFGIIIFGIRKTYL